MDSSKHLLSLNELLNMNQFIIQRIFHQMKNALIISILVMSFKCRLNINWISNKLYFNKINICVVNNTCTSMSVINDNLRPWRLR